MILKTKNVLILNKSDVKTKLDNEGFNVKCISLHILPENIVFLLKKL